MNLLLNALPVLVVCAFIEGVWLQRQHPNGYDWKESLASLGVAIGQPLFNVLSRGLALGVFSWVWEYRLFTIPLDTLWGIANVRGVTLAALLKANPQIRNPNLITVGERVILP